MRWLWIGLFMALVLVAGYRYNAQSTRPVARESLVAARFAGAPLFLELATSSAMRARGLGGRTSLPQDQGMLFSFIEDRRHGFWMKDTLIPLDLFWLDVEGRVVHLERQVLPESYPTVWYPSVPARHVLETNAGFADAHGVSLGTQLQLQNFPRVSE